MGSGSRLTCSAIGLVAGTRIAGPILRAVGPRRVLRIGVPALATGLALLPFASGLGSLAAILAVIGLASGVLDVAMNTEVVAVEDRFDRRVMSSLHGSWSAGLLVGAAIATASIAAGVPMAVQLSVLALVLVVASFPSCGGSRLPANRSDGPCPSRPATGARHRPGSCCSA